MYQVQARLAMEQHVYSSGPHTRTSKGISKDHQKKDLLYRGSSKIFIQELPMGSPNPHTSTDADICKIMQGPLEEEFNKISTRSSHKNLCKIMQGPLSGFHQDPHNIFSQGPLQDHALQGPLRGFHQDLYISLQDLLTRNCKSLTKNFMPGPLGESHKIFRKGPAAAGGNVTRCYKILIQEPSKRSHQDLHKIFY